ncbi:complement factor H-related protein 3-like [Corapipo altera]|uniref:complement factor H-related protein 3-like n=1 Tax=Corapipo altera TaxID=415028 RepID=UPI000FD6279F|nr:complement factor H-related protein 3-like [Corapipo altera]
MPEDRIEYSCLEGYKTANNMPTDTTRCGINGEWSPAPECLVACTASEEDMDRNNVELKWSRETKLYSTSGDYIEFDCKAGYVKEQEPSHYKVQCVEGVLDYPRCRLGRSCTVNTNHTESNNIQLQSPQSRTSTYRSGDFIFFECKSGYRQISRTEKFRAQCLDGAITYPTCQSRFG